ncbi:MAG TPA: transketolase, partial [Acidimicrobiia bacterium]
RIAYLSDVPTRARLNAVAMVGELGLGYLGQVFSSAEILTAIMGRYLRTGIDRFVLSPSHYVTAMYAVAVELGQLDREALETYGRDGSPLETIGSERTPVVDFTCGSLAQGLSVGIGYALANRLGAQGARTVVFGSDGEMEEGQTWEAAMFAAHQGLTDLTLVLDCNDSQVDGPVSSVTTIEPLVDKWVAFGWHAVEVDGHDFGELTDALDHAADEPKVIVARTTATAALSTLEGLDDAHFIKVDADLKSSLADELEGRL